MSANAEANAVFVTGGDYRNTGFSVGDTILIYSDADPMGLERTITAIATSASGVKLSFSSAINPGLYETSDNAYVENQAHLKLLAFQKLPISLKSWEGKSV